MLEPLLTHCDLNVFYLCWTCFVLCSHDWWVLSSYSVLYALCDSRFSIYLNNPFISFQMNWSVRESFIEKTQFRNQCRILTGYLWSLWHWRVVRVSSPIPNAAAVDFGLNVYRRLGIMQGHVSIIGSRPSMHKYIYYWLGYLVFSYNVTASGS